MRRTDGPRPVLPARIIERMFKARGNAVDDHGLLPLTWQWDRL